MVSGEKARVAEARRLRGESRGVVRNRAVRVGLREGSGRRGQGRARGAAIDFSHAVWL